MNDPRAANCQQFTTNNNGQVVGVLLTYLNHATAPYELLRVDLVDEIAAQGTTTARVQVLDTDNLPVQVKCALCYPWDIWQAGQQFQNTLLPGNSNYPYEHIITNGYVPPNQGPLAVALLDAQNNVISDVIGGLGLPLNRHVGYSMIFRQRGTDTDDPGNVDTLTRIAIANERIATALEYMNYKIWG